MAKKQREWTQVSSLVGRMTFDVGGGKDGEKDFVPETKGFVLEARFVNETDKTYKALSSVVIDAQGALRTYYRAHKKFPFPVGKPFVVIVDKGESNVALPAATHIDRLEAQVASDPSSIAMADKIRVARMFGLPIPQEWLDLVGPVAPEEEEEDTEESEYKYAEDQLQGLSVAKLKVLAQKEELEGYDELTKEELVEELALLEK